MNTPLWAMVNPKGHLGGRCAGADYESRVACHVLAFPGCFRVVRSLFEPTELPHPWQR